MRTEYDAWQMEMELDYYEHTGEVKYLENAKELFRRIMTMQSPEGGFYKDSTTDKIYSGEVGLVAWGFFRLYKITKDEQYLMEGNKALSYLETHPSLPEKDEPRLYNVFLAWNNYAYVERSTISDKEKYLDLAIQNANILLNNQGMFGNWTIVLHYDLYVAQNLLFMYQSTNNKKYLDSVLKFVDFARWHTFKGLFPIHYFPFGIKELASGYSSNQYARLMFDLFIELGDETYLDTAHKIVKNIEKRLVNDGMVYKTLINKDKNELATMWLARNKLVKEQSKIGDFYG